MSTERSQRAFRPGFLAVALVGACSGSQHPVQHAMRPLEEARAIEVVLEGFQQAGVQPERHRTIHLTGGKALEIDVATAGHDHGVEYVSAQDRVDLGDALPHRPDPNALFTCVGVGPDASVDVLLLDDQDYQYEPDPSLADPEHPTFNEVEDRLRRNVVDYLTYLRQHGQI